MLEDVHSAAAVESEPVWSPPRATGANVLIVPDRVEHETFAIKVNGRYREHTAPKNPEGLLSTGREIQEQTGFVVGMGPWAREQLGDLEGQRIVWQRDKFNEFIFDGVTVCVLNVRTHCKCGREMHADNVLGVLPDG